MRSIIVAAAAVLLASCASPQQTKAEIEKVCFSRGHIMGTAEFDKCVKQQQAQRGSPLINVMTGVIENQPRTETCTSQQDITGAWQRVCRSNK